MKNTYLSITALACLLTMAGMPLNALAQNAAVRDTTYKFTGASNGLQVLSVAEQPDGKVLVAGDFTALNRRSTPKHGRLKEDGTTDSSYSNIVSPNAPVRKIGVQPNGKIILVGGFDRVTVTGVAVQNKSGIYRLNADGTPDDNFATNIGTGASSVIDDFSLLPNGNIVVVGGFTTFNGVSSPGYIMLDSTGRVDPNFVRGTGFFNYVSVTLPLPDGKFLTSNNNLRKFNADGTMASGFTMSPTISVLPNSMCMQSDGKILIAGDFTTVGTAAAPRIFRFNADGTPDNTFNPGTGFDARVRHIMTSADDKIYAVGDFRNVNGTARTRMARLNADGTLDTSFDPGAGLNNPGFTQVITRAGKLIIGGSFYVDILPNTRIQKLTRFIGPGVIVSSPKPVAETTQFDIYPNPAEDLVRIQNQDSGTRNYTLTNTQGQVVLAGQMMGAEHVLSVALLPRGLYLLHVQGAGVQRLVKQ